MPEPKISIIIPVYNAEKYLSKCLNSILNQTYTNYEVILIDDGSSDTSGSICDEYAKREVRFKIIHQPNAGVSAARNNGIEHAQGEWITFVDPDDWLDNDFLSLFNLDDSTEFSISGLRYIKWPECSIIKTWNFEEKEIILTKDFNFIAQNNLLEYGTVCCKAYRKRLLDKYHIRFDNRISLHEDHLLFFQYLHCIDRIAVHNAVGYNYRITYSGQSLSSKIHSWDKLNTSGDAMFRELIQLKFFYQLPIWYQKKITTFCLYPKMRACRSIFIVPMSESERKSAYAAIICDSNIIRKYFHPAGLKNKIAKICMLIGYLPLKLYFICRIRYIQRK